MPLIRGRERESQREHRGISTGRRKKERERIATWIRKKESSSWMHSILLSFWLKWQIVDGRLEYFTFTSTFAAVLASARFSCCWTNRSINRSAGWQKEGTWFGGRKNEPKKVEKTWHTSKRVNKMSTHCRCVDCSTQQNLAEKRLNVFNFR